MRIIAVGDIGIHGRVAELLRSDRDSLIGPTQAQLSDADLVLGNLELPIALPGEHVRMPATGAAPPEAARLLRDWGFTHLSLANNHIMDLGEKALLFTIENLRAAGVTPFGAGPNEDEASRPLLIDTDPPIALLGYSMRCPANASDNRAGSALFRPRETENRIRLLRAEGRTVIVSLHMGRMYLRRPSPTHLRLTERLLDAGATLVLCHHSHVPAGMIERERGVAALGLGEFVFDPHQGEIRTLVGRRSRRTGVILRADIEQSGDVTATRAVVQQTETGAPVMHEAPDGVLRRWRKWDREFRLPGSIYKLLYYLIEYPRLLIYVGSAALIYLFRGNFRKFYATTFGLLAGRSKRRE